MPKTLIVLRINQFKWSDLDKPLEVKPVVKKPEFCLKCNHTLDFEIEYLQISICGKKFTRLIQGLCDKCNVIYYVGMNHRLKTKNS